MASQFAKLVCGDSIGDSQLSKSLKHLSNTLDNIIVELPEPYGQNPILSPLYAPFLARSLLEASFTSLVARIDPFRILTIGGAQSHVTYDANTASNLAFRWTGDVLADGATNLWNPKTKAADVPRALLGDYQEKLFWRPSFERFLDVSNQKNNPKEWTSALVKIGIDGFIPTYRALASNVFSRASKGVHHEYVLPPATYFDLDSLKDLIDDTIKTVLTLAIVANFCDYYSYRLPEDEAYEIFESYQP